MGKSKKRDEKSGDEEDNTSMETNDQDDVTSPAAKKSKVEDEPVKERSPDLAKFWKAVEDDPTDFTGWTYLLQFVDSTGSIEDGREAYDAFLFRYPYCYGYWKKYADLEKRKGSPEKCLMVFERGIKAIALSSDLWIHYLNHVKEEFSSKEDFVRAQYERAVEACGREWRSDKLWDHYVKWEIQRAKDEKNFSRVVHLYDRILRNPTQGLSHQFDMFKDFVKEHDPKELLDDSDFLSLRKEVLSSLKKSDQDSESQDDSEVVLSDEENKAMIEKIILTRRKTFKNTEESVQLRWKYEDAIKRPYFHMKPLERGQLKNWSDYLEFEEEQWKKSDDKNDTILTILFERCVIACALYEEFWMKYVHWLARAEQDHDKEERIRDVFHRACTFHLPDKVDIHLNWAAFEEERGHLDKAKTILENLQKKHPQLMSITFRRINLERRAGNIEQVHSLFKTCIDKAQSVGMKAELAVKYARFLRLMTDDNGAAKDILQSILDNGGENNAKIYMQLLDIELHQKPFVSDNVIKILDMAIACNGMPARQKLIFSQRKIEFLEDFGKKIDEVQCAKDQHEKFTEEARKEAKNSDSNAEKSITAKSKVKNGDASTTYQAPSSNSASYAAAHANNYDQYGSRYNYGNYGQYYQGYYQSY